MTKERTCKIRGAPRPQSRLPLVEITISRGDCQEKNNAPKYLPVIMAPYAVSTAISAAAASCIFYPTQHRHRTKLNNVAGLTVNPRVVRYIDIYRGHTSSQDPLPEGYMDVHARFFISTITAKGELMKKIGFVCLALALLESIFAGPAWADRVGPRRHGHTHNPGFALGLGFLSGYGLGYYGRAPYFPPYYRYGPGYGFGPYGYPSYGFVPWHGFTPGYAYPPVVAIPSAPPVYIQQPQPVQPQPPASSDYYWHYCRNPEGYYPYVKNCPEGWLQVSPQPNQ